MERIGQTTTVRVTNLERRPDRMAAFMAQAIHEQLMVVRAVSVLDVSSDRTNGTDSTEDGYFCGGYALNGQGRLAEVEKRLCQLVGGHANRLNELVETHRHPNDQKPFDKEASASEDVLVRIIPSKKACALSHIAS